jgi:hypothetical protein
MAILTISSLAFPESFLATDGTSSIPAQPLDDLREEACTARQPRFNR